MPRACCRTRKGAQEALELLIAAYPRDYAARNNLGVYYNGRGDFEESLKKYQAASEIAPDEPGPHRERRLRRDVPRPLDEASARSIARWRSGPTPASRSRGGRRR